ncbi:alpha/beta hydrolase [Streptomyces niveiscabiei]|uniref:alpha/beta fold hydrolase n=1 Tax=Streptomyces niveiscabiei TaxID=164115 RepID=UPI0029A2FEBD|nr:alpha/beta hydrolase [Streptomyces niveiscabiei]MDX3383772.1 alpha/beta hydrolase [Streptomyces niveiscabiei]
MLGEPDAPRHAVVLAPVMPRWDSGAFFQQVTEPLLGSGHRITIYDTLSLLRDGDGLKALVDRWAAQLAPCADGLDVLAGNALGGAVVQALLAREWTHRARVLLLSAPTVADAGLNGKLERIAAAVGTQGLPAAARLLDEAVSGPGGQPFTGTAAQSGQPPVYDGESAGRRLAAGLRLLRDVDLREPVRAFPGPLLHLYGEQSLLVQRRHLAAGSRPDHCLVGIPQAGMRPHTDRPDLVRDAVARFLRAEKP